MEAIYTFHKIKGQLRLTEIVTKNFLIQLRKEIGVYKKKFFNVFFIVSYLLKIILMRRVMKRNVEGLVVESVIYLA